MTKFLKIKDLRCPYCGSRRIESSDEYRFCCLFKHGELTLEQLEDWAIKLLEKVEVEFECRDCERFFKVVYKPVAIKEEDQDE